MKYHTCFALPQIFVDLDGNVLACCMAQKAIAGAGKALDHVFTDKIATNRMIVTENDASACWSRCSVRYATSASPDIAGVRSIVIYTNTLCPLACEYCSLAHTQDAPEWNDNVRPDAGTGIWSTRNRMGKFVSPSRVGSNNMPDLLGTVKRLVDAASDRQVYFEFTGGDSAYHPEFIDTLDFLASARIPASYLSSGIIPPAIRDGILRHVASGMLGITASPDAITPETWSAIKRRPARLFDHVLEFLHDAAKCQVHNQVAAKFIVAKQNLDEAPVFTQFYAAIGLKKFVLSEYRPQPMYFVSPPSEEELAAICRNVGLVFSNESFSDDCELRIIGLERYFGDKTCFVYGNVRALPDWARPL